MHVGHLRRLITERLNPVRPWFSKVSHSSLRDDAMAGLTNAAIVLPQGVAFAIIAGLPPEYGLYTAMIPPIIAALYGSSMVMVSGPTTAISAVLFATLSEFALPGTPAYIQFALVLTVMVGVMQLAAGILRLGTFISFISHSVIVGFTAAAALLIGASQLAPALGLTVERGGGVVERLQRVFEVLSQTNLSALFLAALTLLTILISQRLDKRLPSYLIALIVGTIAGLVIDAPAQGIAMFSALPSVVPSFEAPHFSLSTLAALAPGAATIGLVALLEAISIGRAFALRREEAYDSNQEIVGQGLSNIVGGFMQCYAGSGSFTRSALNVESGAKTPLSAIFAAIFLFALLLAIAPFVRFIPVPAMAGIILYVAWRLINFSEIRHIVDGSRSETIILALTFLSGIAIELEFAIVVGVVSSLFVFLQKTAHPLVAILSPAIHMGHRTMRGARHHGLNQCPQIAVMRIEGPLYFASVEFVDHQIADFEAEYGERRTLILHCRGVGHIDLAGADFLIRETAKLRKRGGDLHLIATYATVLDSLKRTHVTEIIHEENIHLGKGSAIATCVANAKNDICRTCTKRVFKECAEKPGPEGYENVAIEQTLGPKLY
jgi:sulfate permease, SulP family